MFIAIAAMAKNRVIGLGNTIPWYLPEEFKHFKATTLGHTLIMGRLTYESIGRPLPGRETWVLSKRTETIPGVRVINSLPLDLPENRKFYICGGAEIYKLALPLCSELILSYIHLSPAGDKIFPAFESLFDMQNNKILKSNPQFTVVQYSKLSHC